MSSKHTRWIAVVVGAMFICIGGYVLQPGSAASASPRSELRTCVPSTCPIVQASGAPAIQASNSLQTQAAGVAITVISAQAVASWAQSQSGVFGGQLIGKPSIASITLVTLEQLRAYLRQPQLTLSSSPLYYLVVLNNQVHWRGPAGSNVTTNTVWEIIDASTGNLLGTGGMN
jgi:hypothetical protein